MYVSELLVKGFRSLKDVHADFYPGLNVLVGKNNAGKSNLIAALDILLGEKWPTYATINDRDFYYLPSTNYRADNFLIAIKLVGKEFNQDVIIKENVKAYICELNRAPDWEDNDTLDDAQTTSLGTKNRQWRSGNQLANLLGQAISIWFYILVPRGASNKDRMFAAFVELSAGKWFQLTKFGGELRDALVTTALVPSFRDPAQQLRITQFTWYGKLIKSLYEGKSHNQETRIQRAREQLSDTLDEIFESATADLKSRLETIIFHNGITFKAGSFTRDDEHKQITIFIDDGLNTPYYEKGSGIQSALVIALFATYCNHFHRAGSLLLAEEPELYLHPQARRAVEGQLVEFVREGMRKKDGTVDETDHQVIISTHAAEFLRTVELRAICCARKASNEKETTIKQITSLSEETLRRYRQMIRTKNTEMFFADYVILVEGGEEYILPALADLSFGYSRWLDSYNISVIRVDGKMQFLAYSSVLKELGIPHSILTDLDFLYQGSEDFLPSFSPTLVDNLKNLQAVLKKHLPEPRGKDVKKMLSPDVHDWVKLYHEVNETIGILSAGMTLDASRIEGIQNLWNQLRERAAKPEFNKIPEAESLLLSVLHTLSEERIFILSKGDLEEYLTEEAMSLDGSKDRRALAIAEKLSQCSSIEEASVWIDYKEFLSLLESIAEILGIKDQQLESKEKVKSKDELGTLAPIFIEDWDIIVSNGEMSEGIDDEDLPF